MAAVSAINTSLDGSLKLDIFGNEDFNGN